MVLDEQTPAERAGIKVEDDNKWLTIIQNATKNSSGELSNSHATYPDGG